MPIDTFLSPESSNIHSASYDPTSKVLIINFKDKKKPEEITKAFKYQGFTQQLWTGFKAASSKGGFAGLYIYKRYKGEEV